MLTVVWLAVALIVPASVCATGQTEEATAEGPLVIDWLGYSTVGQPAEGNMIQPEVEEKYGVTFDVWYVDKQQYDEALGVRFAAGEMPDYMLIFNPSNIGKYVEQGVLAPITDDIFDKLPTYNSIIEEYDTDGTIYNDVMVGGQIYALRRINLNTAYPTVLVWRTDWLENVGINKIPETLDEFTEALTRFTFDDPDGNGRDDTYGMSDSSMGPFFGAFGPIPMYRYSNRSGQRLHWSLRDGKPVLNVILPEMKDALAYLQGLYEDGIIDPEFVTSENKGGYWALSHSFINGRIGLTGRQNFYHWAPPLSEGDQGGTVYIEFLAANPDAKYGETFEIGTAPVGPDGQAGAYTLGYADVDSFAFTTRGAANERKVDVITQMIEDNLTNFDWSTLLNMGEEGTHYTVNEAGVYTPTAEYAKTPDSIRAGINVFTGGPVNPEFVKQWDPVRFEFADRYDGPKYIPTKVPSTPAADRYLGDLTRLATETYIAIISGAAPVSAFDDFVDRFMANGGEEVMAEAAEAYEALVGE
jgi:putative aldouronate transport system substrate-binding protein